MNQKIIIADDFYDIAYKYHKSFSEGKCLITEETISKISTLLQQEIEVVEAFNEEICKDITTITANNASDWIGVIYLSLPGDCVSSQGIKFYKHKNTDLESFPNDYAKNLLGLQTIEDLQKTFDVSNPNDWKEYADVFIKYNRLVLFRSDLWHSYGSANLNNSIIYQKILLRNGSV